MAVSEEYVEKARKKALQQAAERTHAVLLATQGTAGCPPLDDLLTEIEQMLGWPGDPEVELGHDGPYQHLHWGPVILFVNLNASPWPTFEVYVKATPTLYWMSDEG